MGSRVRLAERPRAPRRNTKNQVTLCEPFWSSSVMTNVRASAAALMLGPCVPPWPMSVGTATVVRSAPVADACTAANVAIRPCGPTYRWKAVT